MTMKINQEYDKRDKVKILDILGSNSFCQECHYARFRDCGSGGLGKVCSLFPLFTD